MKNNKSKSHTSSNNKAVSTSIFVLTPFLMICIIASIMFLILFKPYSVVKPYAKIVFRDAGVTNSVRTLNKYRDDDAPEMVATVKIEEQENTIIYPYYGDNYATLNCENANMIDIPVYWGDTTDLLEIGAGHYNGSRYIGEDGNSVISGHNHTYFYNLKNCKEGDIVDITTSYGKFTYMVSEIVYFQDTDRTYIYPTDDNRLTLYTCWNNGRLGMSSTRLGVICTLTDREFYNNSEVSDNE